MPESIGLGNLDIEDWTTVQEVNEAMDQYLSALVKLERLQEESANLLPYGPMNIGKIGEYFAYVYLRHSNPGAEVIYGKATEKAWDIAVSSANGMIRYQVKTARVGSNPARFRHLEKGFDHLMVILLGKDYFPEDAFLLTNDFEFSYLSTFTIPFRGRKGASVFESHGTNIKNDLLLSMADRF